MFFQNQKSSLEHYVCHLPRQRQDAQDTSQALAEAMQRVAAFDHEVEQQRQLIQRRKHRCRKGRWLNKT